MIETLIVISIMGIIVPSLAVAFMVIVRTTPETEVRLDDARTTRGLATWLSHDTTSAPRFEPMTDQGGIDMSSTINPCGGQGNNILHLQWTEDGFSERTYVSSFRFVVVRRGGSDRAIHVLTYGVRSVLRDAGDQPHVRPLTRAPFRSSR